MKKVNITIEIEKDGRGIYYGRLHRDNSGRLYAKIPSPIGTPTLTLVENLQSEGYSITMVNEKGGKKNAQSNAAGMHKRARRSKELHDREVPEVRMVSEKRRHTSYGSGHKDCEAH